MKISSYFWIWDANNFTIIIKFIKDTILFKSDWPAIDFPDEMQNFKNVIVFLNLQ